MAERIARVDLDRRRGWARARATVTSIVGVGVIGLSAGLFILVLLAALARFWTWIRNRDLDQTGLWNMAPEAFTAVGIVSIAACTAIAFRWFWSGRVDLLLAEMKAEPLADGATTLRMVRNVTEELSIGLGRPMPELFAVKEGLPNALSLRSRDRRVLCVTTGTARLPRDECEALVAHELGHLWAHDSHWVTSGMVGLSMARRTGTYVAMGGSILTFMTVATAWGGGRLLWSAFLFGAVLTIVGVTSGSLLRRFELGMRRHADEMADVVAIRLARNPESLAALCARLADDDSNMTGLSWRSELLWFEMPWLKDQMTDELEQVDRNRARRELITRAQKAYAEASMTVPEPHATTFAAWLAANPDDSPSITASAMPSPAAPDPPPTTSTTSTTSTKLLTRQRKQERRRKQRERRRLREQQLQSGDPPAGRELP